LNKAANSSIEAEVNSDGLITAVQPAANAGASFQLVRVSGDAFGFVFGVSENTHLVGGNDMTFDLVGHAAIIIEIFRHVFDLAGHFSSELAIVIALDLGQARRMLHDQIGQLAQQLAAACRSQLRPRAFFESLFGGGNGVLHIAFGAACDLTPSLAAIGILGGKIGARYRRDLTARDVVPVPFERLPHAIRSIARPGGTSSFSVLMY
jgi:hypothetical protein